MTTVDGEDRYSDENSWANRLARRYGVPATMVERATRRREAGDWRGACAAARFDIRFELTDIRNRFGAQVAAQVEQDLTNLAPDLVRWHLPRWREGLLEPERVVILATYDGPALVVTTPRDAGLASPRLALHVSTFTRADPMHVEDWTAARYLWDATAAHLLRHRLGGGDRTPFFHRDGRALTAAELATPRDGPVALMEQVLLLQDSRAFGKAWAAAGVRAQFPTDSFRGRGKVLPILAAMVPAFVSHARGVLSGPSAPGELVLHLPYPWGVPSVRLSLHGGELRARQALTEYNGDRQILLPRVRWQRFPDLELLRSGEIGPEEVHPLVRAAMFPEQPDPGYHPRLPTVDAEFPVQCRGAVHVIGWRGGRITPLHHSPEQIARERILKTLGGEAPDCVAIVDAWHRPTWGGLPLELIRMRADAQYSLRHGDIDRFRQFVDAGIDPTGLRDESVGTGSTGAGRSPLDYFRQFVGPTGRREHPDGMASTGAGRSPLDYLARVDELVADAGPAHSYAAALVPWLLAAGLELEARETTYGRTALANVLYEGASADLVRALLDAGADALARDRSGLTTLHLLRSPDAELIVPWLVDAGVEVDAHDVSGRTPIQTQVLLGAPAEAVRATLAAGADPAVFDPDDVEVVWAMRNRPDDDLSFLVAAARTARTGAS